ncbi:MAG: Mur ligase domain-containing protein, partial [Phycisphaerae bacterium]|nr:Mur ligase domain-containing protein [Phycisphaerae bacterium]
MKLSELLAGFPGAKQIFGPRDVLINRVEHDSRRAGEGVMFVAISGSKRDGHEFVAQASEAGAAAVVVEREVEVRNETAVVLVPNARQALAAFAHLL